MARRSLAALAIAVLVAFGGACSDNGPGGVSVAGSWSGVTSFASGFSTSMSLTQSGTAVGGTMTVSGAFIGNAFTGTLNAANRTVEWEVLRGCEVWGGTLTISADQSEMTGPVLVDTSGCSSGTDASGTVRVTRQ